MAEKPEDAKIGRALVFLGIAGLFQMAAGAFVLCLIYVVVVIIFRYAFTLSFGIPMIGAVVVFAYVVGDMREPVIRRPAYGPRVHAARPRRSGDRRGSLGCRSPRPASGGASS